MQLGSQVGGLRKRPGWGTFRPRMGHYSVLEYVLPPLRTPSSRSSLQWRFVRRETIALPT